MKIFELFLQGKIFVKSSISSVEPINDIFKNVNHGGNVKKKTTFY